MLRNYVYATNVLRVYNLIKWLYSFFGIVICYVKRYIIIKTCLFSYKGNTTISTNNTYDIAIATGLAWLRKFTNLKLVIAPVHMTFYIDISGRNTHMSSRRIVPYDCIVYLYTVRPLTLAVGLILFIRGTGDTRASHATYTTRHKYRSGHTNIR